MQLCNLCPNRCNLNRAEKIGFCGADKDLKIAKYSLFFYEEPLISGKCGSGAVFFCGCSLKCVFCQNYELSQNTRGKTISPKELADIFKNLEDLGAHNINLVNPTHYALQIIEALNIYRPNIPIVWNTHGYENLETLQIINPYADIYLTDLKYFSPERSKRYCNHLDYFEKASKAFEFMQGSKKTVIKNGLMQQGVIVRHLVLPLNTDDSLKILNYLSSTINADVYLSLMAQYTPFGNIENFTELKRRITKREYEKVVCAIQELSLKNVFLQEYSSASQSYIPKWDY